MKNLSTNSQAMLLSLLGFSLFAIGDVYIKLLADDGYKAIEIAFFLNFFYLPFLLLLSPVIGGIKATLRTENLWLHVLRALLGVGTFMIVVNGFHKLGLSLSYTLIFAAPFFAAIISAVFLKQKINFHRWASIAIGFIGVLVVLRPFGQPIEPAAVGLLLAALFIATNHILTKKVGGDEPLMAFSLFHCIIAIQVFGIMNFWDGEMRIPAHKDWLIYLTIALFHTGGMLATSKAFATGETVIVAPFHYVQLLWGTLFGILIFANIPDVWTGIGAFIIVFSGIYLLYREHVRKDEVNTGLTSHGAIDQD